jgi:serine/threonine-protein kinase
MIPDGLSTALSDRYRVERELGQGGMATVYLAEDLKHKRKVALKVLKPELAAVLGAERFVQEITTTAALQHPHILPLFDSGTADGFLFYVMPFIDGETLRARLDRETQLGVEDAVRIAREVADALEHAHQRGIVHRDVKPENILLHGGHALVADFGIALAVSAAAGGRMTETGLSLGTPHYMSPEQATAEKEITARSDVYSLGSVLYEMLSGQPPHLGGSAQQIIMKIIAEPVQVVTALRKSVPANVAAAVAKALEKLPADRFESARGFSEALANPAFTDRSVERREATSARRSTWTGRATAAAITGLAALALWGWIRGSPAPAAPNIRVLIDFPEGRAPIFWPGGAFALSPDGARLAYMGGGRRVGRSDVWRLWIRPLDRLAADSVPGSEGAHSPVWSPGGDSLAFIVGDELRVFSTLPGGGVATIAHEALSFGASWAAGGILVVTRSGLGRIDPSTGVLTLLITKPGDPTNWSWPYWVPNGSAATFTIRNAETGTAQVALAHLGEPPRIDTLTEGFNGRVLSNGELLWADPSGTVYTAPLDVDQGRLRGGRAQLVAGVLVEPGLELRLSASERGAMVYALDSVARAGSRIVVIDRRTGERTELPMPPEARPFPDLHLSPDGSRVAWSGVRGIDHDIRIYSFATGQLDPFTVGGINDHPIWSPDGRRLAYCREMPADQLVSRPVDRQQPAVAMAIAAPSTSTGTFNNCPRSWTADGATLILEGGWTLTPPDTIPRRAPGGVDGEFAPAVSPNGRWLAYVATRDGTPDVWIRGFRSGSGPWQVSRGGGFDPVWSRDGRSLYFRTDSTIMMATVVAGDAIQTGPLQRVTSVGSAVSAIDGQSFDVFPDGQRLVVFESGTGASVEHLIFETNVAGRARQAR